MRVTDYKTYDAAENALISKGYRCVESVQGSSDWAAEDGAYAVLYHRYQGAQIVYYNLEPKCPEPEKPDNSSLEPPT